ncbi:MAG TPA: BadF/BadG/BcrA/BcrD ATPase family protein [Candidatus Acidoferrales bacterium]|jgi:glucosamine kinase|nr:BadF/BadG/BcrA/BcrD ATPase family protein [Candidatus Acidoferrales bacterium]
MPERIVVGVDAGGSRTVAVAAAGESVGEPFIAGPANPQSAGVEQAAVTIANAVAGALGSQQADAVFVGAAGAWNGRIAGSLREALEARLPGARIDVTHDAAIALRAAVPDGDGLLLVAGTGSIAYAEIGEKRFRSGGLGHTIGDEGSGYAIGAATLRLMGKAFDGRALRDAMLDAVAAKLGVLDAQELVSAVADPSTGPAAVASVASIVIEHADAGDRSATKIVQGAALDLFELVRAVVRASAAADRELPLVFAGGLLRENSMLTYLLETRIANELPLVHVLKGGPEAHVGALAAARRLAQRP